ncbi:MAG: hypothetical protein RIT45_2753 [Pseudomonadota bacterium]
MTIDTRHAVEPFTPGLDPEEAELACASMRVAASAAQRDGLPWIFAAVAAALLGVLGAGELAQARFAERTTFLHRDKPVPAHVVAVDWVEAPRTVDAIIASIRADRGR